MTCAELTAIELCEGRSCSQCDADSRSSLASTIQVGGNHYKDMAVQPAEYNQRNKLNWCEANIVKYASRHKHKNGAEDIKKIIHYANLLLEWEYPSDV